MRSATFSSFVSLALLCSLCVSSFAISAAQASRISVTTSAAPEDFSSEEAALLQQNGEGLHHLGQHSVWTSGERNGLGEKAFLRVWRMPTQRWKVVQEKIDEEEENNEGHDVLIARERLEDGHASQRETGSQSWDAEMRSILIGESARNGMLSRASSRVQAVLAAAEETKTYTAKKTSISIEKMTSTYAIVHVESTAALIELSTQLPADTRMVRLPSWSLPIVNASRPAAVDASAESLKKPKFHKPRYIPPIHALLFSSALDIEALRADARVLTGEDQDGQIIAASEEEEAKQEGSDAALQHWNSRHSATWGSRTAAEWIRQRMQRDLSTVGAKCEAWSYDPYFAPNVVCTIPPAKKTRASDDGIVVFSSHLDSRGSFGSTLAPGGNDDGSGTTMLLALARHLGQHKIEFEREVRLVAFSGEEQGLVGSQHYAKYLHEQGAKIKLALQTDMIGYRKPGEPLQLAFPDKLSTQEATDYIMAIAKIYVPELTVGYTPACCSDHQSFWEQDFPATWVFERNGPIADDRYHNSGDVTAREGYDFRQIRASTRVVLASLLDVAGGVEWGW